MFQLSLMCLRKRSRQAARAGAGITQLRRELQSLKSANRVAAAQLQERRRLATLLHRRQQQDQQHTEEDGNHTTAGASAAAAAASSTSLALLPRNDALDTAIALTLCANRDARTELELTRRLLGSTLLSLASPVGPWDPYDVKPQVFALDTYLALPVFTSLAHLKLFCDRFGFVTRDPSGVLWADGTRPGAQEGWQGRATALLPDFGATEISYQQQQHQQQQQKQEEEQERDEKVKGGEKGEGEEESIAAAPAEDLNAFMDAGDLFDDLHEDTNDLLSKDNNTTTMTAATSTGAEKEKEAMEQQTKKKKKKNKKNKRLSAKQRVKRAAAEHRQKVAQEGGEEGATEGGTATAEADAEKQEAKERFWQSLAKTHPFGLTQATPLPTFGPFIRPFFVGYFADVDTLLHNASIVPEKVDIILNPTSPTEFVLAREATDRVLHKDQLLHIAYQRVERELQREFGVFLAQHCGEVQWAASACVPRPLDLETAEALYAATQQSLWRSANPLQEHLARTQVLRELDYSNRVLFDLVILIESDDMAETFAKIQRGKHQCLLVGHQDLDVVPVSVAAPHVREIAKRFYDRERSSGYRAAEAEAEAEEEAASPQLEMGTIQIEAVPGGEAGQLSSSQQPLEAEGGSDDTMGVFRRAGPIETINIAQDADSYYHDPTNAYTEPHAVFTEELRLKRGGK